MTSAQSAASDTSGQPSDDTEYTVAYLNGVTEDVTGVDAARMRLIHPASRVEEAQDAPLGGTYYFKR